jgi:hypothetical protein
VFPMGTKQHEIFEYGVKEWVARLTHTFILWSLAPSIVKGIPIISLVCNLLTQSFLSYCILQSKRYLSIN